MSERDEPFQAPGTKKEYSRGSFIMWQGQLEALFQTIVSGRVDGFVGLEPRLRVASLGPGDFFGETA